MHGYGHNLVVMVPSRSQRLGFYQGPGLVLEGSTLASCLETDGRLGFEYEMSPF